jgi:hypothetical protein
VAGGGSYNRRHSLTAGTKGKLFRFTVQNNTDNQQMEFKGIDIYAKILPLRHLPLTVDGGGGIVARRWTTAGRPTNPYIGQTGYNTDYAAQDTYQGENMWMISDGTWTESAKPATTYLAVGSFGWNTTLSVSERWTGIEWERD